jgi:hypothetical protein
MKQSEARIVEGEKVEAVPVVSRYRPLSLALATHRATKRRLEVCPF